MTDLVVARSGAARTYALSSTPAYGTLPAGVGVADEGTASALDALRRQAARAVAGSDTTRLRLVAPRAGGVPPPVLDASERQRRTEVVLRHFGIDPAALTSPTKPKRQYAAHLAAARNNPAGQPLQGLKIALDPGHMGKSFVAMTGKYIEHQGVRLSEADIALQVTKLLQGKLEALGATVMSTRLDDEPVTKERPGTLDLDVWGDRALAAAVDSTWFQRLLERGQDDAELVAAFEADARVKSLYADRERNAYFMKADLQARVDAISTFNPDLTLVVHFDAGGAGHGLNARAPKVTKVYVPVGSSDPTSRQTSVDLSRAVVDSLCQGLGLQPQASHGPNASKIEPGVFARDLALTRGLADVPIAFVETLFYDRPEEFAALADVSAGKAPDGTPVSKRAIEIADALVEGVKSFVAPPAAVTAPPAPPMMVS